MRRAAIVSLISAGTAAEVGAGTLTGTGVGLGDERLDFAPGSLAVSIHSGGVMEGKTEIKLL